jgi:hypothetical protein
MGGSAGRVLAALSVVALLPALTACGAERIAARASGNVPPRSVGVDGVSLELPAGWDAYTKRLGQDEVLGEIWAASRQFVEPSPRPAVPYQTLAALSDDGIAIEITFGTPPPGSASWPLRTQIGLDDGYFLADNYEGQPAPHVSTQIIRARVANRVLWVQVFFGRTHPDDAMRALANRVLGSLFRPRETQEDGFVRFQDPAVGVSGRYPAGWYRARALTELSDPREVLALATYPLRGGAEAGECAPDTARADMPPDGTFIWLLEYRPFGGDAWPRLLRERFPPKPERFELRRSDLSGDHLGCFSSGFGYTTTFRAADRPFQLLVAFGGQPTDERLGEVEGILDSLEFEPQPVPTPDPYAGWPSVNDNPGDSLRPPPGWPATAAMFRLDTLRPRPLFFASNQPLAGLPQKLVPYVLGQLPGPFPSAALADFPADDVLLWVVEDDQGDASVQFPPIGRGWPARADFRQAEPPTQAPAGLRWLHAGGSFRGFRFSLWVVSGSQASDEDLGLALKSGASLAVSSCPRDQGDDCPGS